MKSLICFELSKLGKVSPQMASLLKIGHRKSFRFLLFQSRPSDTAKFSIFYDFAKNAYKIDKMNY